ATLPVSLWNVNSDGVWSAGGNWTGGAPAGSDALASLGPVTTAPRTVTLTSPASVKSLVLDNDYGYTIAGSSPLKLESTTGAAGIHARFGTHVISAPLEVNTATATLEVQAPDAV